MFRLVCFLLKACLSPQSAIFHRKLYDPKSSQEKLLRYLISDLSATNYGRKLRISGCDQYNEFASKVPVVSYDEIASWIDQHRTSIVPALTSHEVIMFERTSGSSGSVKYIPYTRAFLQSFNRMFFLWCHDILVNGPRLNLGKIFMCISPSLCVNEISQNGTRIGADSDLDYVNHWLAIVLKRFLVLPPDVRTIKNPENYMLITSLHLLAEESLEIISIWNPGLLELFLEFIDRNRDDLIGIWRAGRFEGEGLTFKVRLPSPERLELLSEPQINWSRLWPQLKLISCWSSANAKVGCERLQSYFPRTLIQGKGLLATEAPLTIPLIKFGQYVPLIDEVFFEFENNSGNVVPLWHVTEGNTYSLIISQKAGLFRYRLGDRITITGFANKTPCFDFVARDACSDLVGEKLHEDFVARSLESIPHLANTAKILLPILPTEGKAFYILVCEQCDKPLDEAAMTLDNALKDSFHYNHARELKQLDPPRIRIRKAVSLNYISCAHQWGLDLGDIKTPSLIADPSQAKRFLESIDMST